MATYVVIDLVTVAPSVTWGPADGADAGETLTVQLDWHDAVERAGEIIIPGFGTLPMNVVGDTLTVDLPGSTPQGVATVRAYTRDDLGNTRWHELQLPLSGVIVVNTGSGGYPLAAGPAPRPAPARPGPEHRVWRARGSLRSHGRVLRAHTASAPSRARLSSDYRREDEGEHRWRARASTRSAYQVRHGAAFRERVALSAAFVVVRRPEGEDPEDDVATLLLL